MTPVCLPDLAENTNPYTVSINDLILMYKALRNRTKKKIYRDFNQRFLQDEDNTVMTRLFDRRLAFCYDEYEFLCPLVTQHYKFEQWVKSQGCNY